MLVEPSLQQPAFSALDLGWFISKGGVVLMSGLCFMFSLVVVRQVNLMTETLITEVAPYLRALAIIHVGFALGIIVLFVGILFG